MSSDGDFPDVPGLSESCQLDRIVHDWTDAVNAYRGRDSNAFADALAPRDLDDVETYTRLVGLTVLTAHACGQEYRKQHDPTPFGFYAVRIEHVATGQPVDPNASVEDANVTALGRLIVAAANRDMEMVHDLAMAHLRFDGEVDRSGVLAELIGVYCAMTKEAT